MITRTKVVLLVSFLLTFGAGTSVGLLISRPENRPSDKSRSWMGLNLTDEQREQMREIWSSAMGRGRGERRLLAKERDKAVVALLTEEQLPRYEQIVGEYERKMKDLSRERQRRIQEAVERTKRILTPEQVEKYEELRKRRRERARARRRTGVKPVPPTGSTQPATRPAPRREK